MTNLQDSIKMRTVFLVIFTICVLPLYSQQELGQRANTYFERAFYSDVIPLYEQLVLTDRSKIVLKNLADSYYRTYDMHAASRWYKSLTSKYAQSLDETYHFRFSEALKAIGEYEEAEKVLRDHYLQVGDSMALSKLEKDFQYLENINAIGDRFTITNLPLNSSASEFGAVLIDSNLVYTAANKKSTLGKNIYRWNNQNYLDIYSHEIDKIDQGDHPSKSFSSQINTKMHEGTFAVTKDRKTIYFTRNNFSKGKKKTDAKKVSNLKVYKADWLGDDWGNIIELPFNSDAFSTEHPALNQNETKLYFSSDRPGGHGSFDLYSVSILPNGLYGNPINLGAVINTHRKEQFPYLDSGNNLYFASNGHPGFGLLDIFISKYESGTHSKPDNLGLPMNSGYDDFSISFRSPDRGFFSSNRPGGKGSDDIYSFVETKPLIIEDCQQFIAGILSDQTTGAPLSNGTVQVLDGNGRVIKELVTDTSALFNFDIDCNSIFVIHGSREGYEENSKNIVTTKERKRTFDGSLSLLSVQEIKKREQERKQKEEEELLAKEKKAREQTRKAKKIKIDDAIKNEDALVKDKNRTIIKTQEIHFDYSLWYLRRESRERLEVVVKVMLDNPGIVIEVGTHTDIRGNKNYNEELSQKRADVVKEYLIKRGISEDRIIATGYGESRPIVECETENACTEEDHEWNRRCEFVIVEWD